MVGVRGNGAYNTAKYPIQTPPSMLHQGSEFTVRASGRCSLENDVDHGEEKITERLYCQ